MKDIFDSLAWKEEEETKIDIFDKRLKDIDIGAFNEYLEMVKNIDDINSGKITKDNTTHQEFKVMVKDIGDLKHKDKYKVIEMLEILNKDDYLLMEVLKTYKNSLDLSSLCFMGRLDEI